MIEVIGRIIGTAAVGIHSTALRKMQLKPFVSVKLSKGILKANRDLGGITFDDPYLDYRIDAALENEEFKATFLEMLDFYVHQGWGELGELTKCNLRKFYAAVQRYDEIYSEFKAQTRLSTYPKNIVVNMVDYLYVDLEGGEAEHWIAEYQPKDHRSFRTLEDYGLEMKPYDIHIYAKELSLETEGIFIHELIHHLMNIEGLGMTEDEQKMLEVAKKYLPSSWIAKRFEEHVKARLT